MVWIRKGGGIDGLDLDLDQAQWSGSGRDGVLMVWLHQGSGVNSVDQAGMGD